MGNRELRLVISGTYSTGKTTTATALSIATGLPLIDGFVCEGNFDRFISWQKISGYVIN